MLTRLGNSWENQWKIVFSFRTTKLTNPFFCVTLYTHIYFILILCLYTPRSFIIHVLILNIITVDLVNHHLILEVFIKCITLTCHDYLLPEPKIYTYKNRINSKYQRLSNCYLIKDCEGFLQLHLKLIHLFYSRNNNHGISV